MIFGGRGCRSLTCMTFCATIHAAQKPPVAIISASLPKISIARSCEEASRLRACNLYRDAVKKSRISPHSEAWLLGSRAPHVSLCKGQVLLTWLRMFLCAKDRCCWLFKLSSSCNHDHGHPPPNIFPIFSVLMFNRASLSLHERETAEVIVRYVNSITSVGAKLMFCVKVEGYSVMRWSCAGYSRYALESCSSQAVRKPLSDLAQPRATRDPSKPPPRPQNKFMLFRTDFCHRYNNRGLSMPGVSSAAAAAWRMLGKAGQDKWEALAVKEKATHNYMYPDYKYSPQRKRGATCILIMVYWTNQNVIGEISYRPCARSTCGRPVGEAQFKYCPGCRLVSRIRKQAYRARKVARDASAAVGAIPEVGQHSIPQVKAHYQPSRSLISAEATAPAGALDTKSPSIRAPVPLLAFSYPGVTLKSLVPVVAMRVASDALSAMTLRILPPLDFTRTQQQPSFVQPGSLSSFIHPSRRFHSASVPEFFSLPPLLVSRPSSGSSTSNSSDADPCTVVGAGEMQVWDDASSSSSPRSDEQMSIHTSTAAVSPDFSNGQSTLAHSTLNAHSSQIVTQRAQNLRRN
jgi:hypothetical protein